MLIVRNWCDADKTILLIARVHNGEFSLFMGVTRVSLASREFFAKSEVLVFLKLPEAVRRLVDATNLVKL